MRQGLSGPIHGSALVIDSPKSFRTEHGPGPKDLGLSPAWPHQKIVYLGHRGPLASPVPNNGLVSATVDGRCFSLRSGLFVDLGFQHVH